MFMSDYCIAVGVDGMVVCVVHGVVHDQPLLLIQ